MSAVVALDSISKSYDQKVAVHNLSFSIERGSMFGLLGPNGAGKTSSIRMIVGITLPDSGQVNLFGQKFHRGSLQRVGYLPEERGLYKKMKILDQLIFLGELRGLSPSVATQRAKSWCDRLDILDSISKNTEELSKGMQQKIQFISTLMHDPDFIIMDEPFSGLDPVNTSLLQDTLVELKNKGKAILFSTHRMDQVEKLCDTICLVNKGEAVLSGAMRKIKSSYPRNRVLIEYEGSDAFLQFPGIDESKTYSGSVEIKLKPEASAQDLLHLAASHATINKFELVEPSLEEIFIETVGGRVDA